MNNQTKHKISLTMMGKKKAARHRYNISESLKGRELSNEHKNNIRTAMRKLWKRRKEGKK